MSNVLPQGDQRADERIFQLNFHRIFMYLVFWPKVFGNCFKILTSTGKPALGINPRITIPYQVTDKIFQASTANARASMVSIISLVSGRFMEGN